MGMQAVDLAIQNGVDLDGTPIPQKMLDLYNRIINEENKDKQGVKKINEKYYASKRVLSILIKKHLINY